MDRFQDQNNVSETWPRYLFWVVLALLPALYLTQELSGLSSGTGGQDWKIGPSVATLNNGYQRRSLLDLRRFALQLVNRDRAVNGLAPLVEDPQLSQAAQRLAQDRLAQRYFASQLPKGTTSNRFRLGRGQPLAPNLETGANQNTLFSRSAYSPALTYSEVEKNQKTWMYSLESREKILGSSYTRFGYGISTHPASGDQVAAQIFAGPELLK